MDASNVSEQNIVTVIIDEDVSYTYAANVPVVPKQDLEYLVKMNDALSKNIPFKENVCTLLHINISNHYYSMRIRISNAILKNN